MTMPDMDWGEDAWDVDKKAESLNKALFGKKQKNVTTVIKADLNTEDQDGIDFGKDSDDDDDKLSKKAKKKLKERKRKENKRDGSNNNVSNEENGGKKNIGKVQNHEVNKKNNIKSVKSDSSTSTNKKKMGKSQDIKLENKKKIDKGLNGKSESSAEGDNKKETLKMKKKRKKSLEKSANEEAVSPTKQKKTGDDNSDSTKEGEPKTKRKRTKKRKPNSKKNKYLHLVKAKSDKPASSDSDSDSDEGESAASKECVRKTDPTNSGMKGSQETGKKRKRSLSPELTQVKKKKIVDQSAKDTVIAKEQKTACNNIHGEGKINGKKDVTSLEKSRTSLKKEKKMKSLNVLIESKNEKKLKNNSKNKSIDTSETVTGSKTDNKSASKQLKKEKKAKLSDEGKNLNKKEKETKSKTKSSESVANSTTTTTTVKASPFLVSSQGSELQQKMMDKLASARFRFINEQLYTIKGGEAFRMFQQDRSLMEAYNTGFQGQVKHWSVNPLDVIIKQLSTKGSQLVVADFGCGEARLSASVPQTVHSFDLCALNERVTVCDMAKTPLGSGSVDVAVFCLSLMGTNLNDYLLEANRVLKEGGLLKIAEVVSRFGNPSHFINAVSSIGFKAVNTRELSTMFYLMDFKKVKNLEKAKNTKPVSLKPCMYKKR